MGLPEHTGVGRPAAGREDVRDRPRARRPRGRPPKLSRQCICEAAAEIGFPDLNIQAVARRLDASPSAIYSYVKDSKELSELLATHLITTIRVSDEADSCERYLVELGWAIRDLVIEYPGLGLFLFRRPAGSAPWMWLIEQMAESLGSRGVRADAAIRMGISVCAVAIWWGERHNASIEEENAILMKAATTGDEFPLFAEAYPIMKAAGGSEVLFDSILSHMIVGMLQVGPGELPDGWTAAARPRH